jgi:mono/diheme cytochrome c family protein
MQNQYELSQAAVVGAAFGSGRFSQPTVVLIVLLIASLSVFVVQPSRAQSLTARLHTNRASPLDLELGGDLANLPPNSARYITREDLLALPQVNFTVVNDANFTGPTQVSGIPLEELVRRFAAAPDSDLTLAICVDKYLASYPPTYIAAHHPVLVLKINGQPPSAWPKDSEGHNLDMGPYLISHANFTPSFKILSHSDEPQIPWSVVRLEFRDANAVFAAIAPGGPQAHDQQVQAGYRIAQQKCFHCHNMGSEGGQKAGRPWLVLSTWATASPSYFAAYVHNPKEKNPNAQMPSLPEYDDATLRALIAYFQTFSSREKP